MNLTDYRWRWDHNEAAWMRDDILHGTGTGDIWSVAEVDLTLGCKFEGSWEWFWVEEESPRIMEELVNIYYKSIGYGQVLNINLPPDRRGLFTDAFVKRFHEFTDAISANFADEYDFVQKPGVTASASSTWGTEFGPANVLSKSYDTYWAMADVDDGWLEVDLGQEREFDVVVIGEHIQLGQRIQNFTVEVFSKGSWRFFATAKTIGYKRAIWQHPVNASRVRFIFNTAGFYALPVIERVRVFKAKGDFALEGRQYPEGLTLMGYAYFDPGFNHGWIDDSDCYVAQGSSLKLHTTFANTTRVWVVGTTDPSYGELEVWIDDKQVGRVSCHSEKRQKRQLLFVSEDLKWAKHKLELRQVGSKPVAIHAVYHTGNKYGMFEFGADQVNADGKKVEVTVRRVSGDGNVSVLFETWPDSALPGKHYEAVSKRLEFKTGEYEKKVTIKLLELKKGARFHCRLSDPVNGVIGFRYRTEIVFAPGLSKGAIAGIACGAGAILVVAVVVSFVCMRREGSAVGLETVSGQPFLN
jgi:alpha-L-fucosidase